MSSIVLFHSLRIKFYFGFYLYSMVTEGFTPTFNGTFDCEWAEVEFDNNFSQTRGLSVYYYFKFSDRIHILMFIFFLAHK